MNASLMTLAVAGCGVLALAGWWIRREVQRSAGRKQRARHAAERAKADDLRDCRVAHESRIVDPAERAAGDPAGGPATAGPTPEASRRRAEERWQRAYSTSSKLDPDLPARHGEGS